MLIINNPYVIAIREGFGDEEMSFWDLADHAAYFFPFESSDEGSPECDEMNALVEGYFRVCDQARELSRLKPEFAADYDKKVKKLLGNKVIFQ